MMMMEGSRGMGEMESFEIGVSLMPLEKDVPQNKRHPPGHFFQRVGCIVGAYFGNALLSWY
jgi:hypothetical protein